MRRASQLIFVLSILVAVPAAAATVDDAVRAIGGLEADFVQKFTPKGFKNPQIERGRVVFGRLPQMRWTYTHPEAKTFVFDGDTSWLYTPADRQAFRNRLSAADKAELPFLVLSNGDALARAYVVSEKRGPDTVTVALKPKAANPVLREIILTTGAGDRRLKRLEYADRQGNRTVFEFSNYRKAATDAATFAFKPPAGVEVVEN